MGIIGNLNLIRKTYKNWLSMAFVIFKNRRKSIQIHARFRDGLNVTIERSQVFQYALICCNKFTGDFKYEIENSEIGLKVFIYWDTMKIAIPPGLVLDLMRLNELHLFKANDESFHDLSNGILRFQYHGTELRLKVIEGNTLNGDLGIFLNEDYSFLKPSGKTIVDIGANISDSAIYFAMNGAKKVIAFEPYPYAYKMGLENISMNGMESIISLFNIGYGKDGIIHVNDSETDTGSDLIENISGFKVETISLGSIIKRFDLPKNVLLKMDCEGCEYNLLSEKDESLYHFNRIQIEYHYGYKKLLKKIYSAGFKVEKTEPQRIYNQSNSNPILRVGNLYAIRK